MSDQPSPDPFLDAEVESAIAPFRAMGFSPELLHEMARTLRIALTSHPTGRYLVSRLRPRVVEESGPAPTSQLDEADDAEAGNGR